MAANPEKKFLNFAKASSIGLSLIFSITVFIVIGYFIDKKSGTFPLFSIIGLIFGMGGGFWLVFKISAETLEE